MHDIIIALIAGFFGGGFLGLVQFLISRKDKQKEQDSTEREALRYLMLYFIEDTASKIIAKGEITLEQKQMLHRWHALYHEGLGGNGDAAVVMEIIDELPIIHKGG